MPDSSFTQRTMRAVNKPVHRLGLALNYGIDADGVSAALDRGVNYLFYTRMKTAKTVPPLKQALAKNREKYVIAAGPTFGFFRSSLRSAVDRTLKVLGCDYLDVLQLFWLGKMSAWTKGNLDELQALKASGVVKSIGVSIHDRPRAGKLAEDSPLDLFMIRYNAAHPGAERDIFPHLDTRKPSVVAYTATAWKKLLKAPRGWSGPTMTAGDCYRFCLTNPNVDVVLTGPASRAELEQNLASVEKGPLQADELEWIRKYGSAVHG